MRKVANMRRHLDNILTNFDCYITNAFSEGINSKIQAIKANARDFRSFKKLPLQNTFLLRQALTCSIKIYEEPIYNTGIRLRRLCCRVPIQKTKQFLETP